MGEYQIELVFSLTSLLESSHHYGRPSEVKRPFVLTPQNKYNGTFVKAIVPLKDENEKKSIIVWLYKEETLADLTE